MPPTPPHPTPGHHPRPTCSVARRALAPTRPHAHRAQHNPPLPTCRSWRGARRPGRQRRLGQHALQLRVLVVVPAQHDRVAAAAGPSRVAAMARRRCVRGPGCRHRSSAGERRRDVLLVLVVHKAVVVAHEARAGGRCAAASGHHRCPPAWAPSRFRRILKVELNGPVWRGVDVDVPARRRRRRGGRRREEGEPSRFRRWQQEGPHAVCTRACAAFAALWPLLARSHACALQAAMQRWWHVTPPLVVGGFAPCKKAPCRDPSTP